MKQKSRELWVKDGDRNTKFFHAFIIVHRRSNSIPSITMYNDLKIWDRDQIKNSSLNQFNVVFSSHNPIHDITLKDLIPQVINKDQNDNLIIIPSPFEVKITL